MATTAPAFWDRIAQRYAASPVANPGAYAVTLERVRAHLKSGDRALELGCGTGTTALKLAPSVAAYRATDYSTGMIEIADSKLATDPVPGLEFRVADAAETFGEGSWDVVLAFNLLHLVRDKDTLVARVHAALKPGGLFISKTVLRPGPGAPWKFRLLLKLLPLAQLVGKAPFVRLETEAEHEGAICAPGFEIVERGDYPARPASRFLVARKI